MPKFEMDISSAPLSGNLLLERLLELEALKNTALLEFDPHTYGASAAEQTRLVSAGSMEPSRLSRHTLVALAKQTRLNLALLLNLVSTSPHFEMMQPGYTAEGFRDDAPGGRLAFQR